MTMVAQQIGGYLLSPVHAGLEEVRLRLGRGVVALVSPEKEFDPSGFAEPAGDPGMFGPRSPVWEVHADASMFVGGIRALLYQSLHPLAMAGVAEHSNYKRQPLRRLQRTAAFIRDTTFGNTRLVDAAIAHVRHVHLRVKGIAPNGRPYAASDPALLRWVHCAEIDSFLAAHTCYGAAPLSPARTDRYIDEMAEVAVRLGADWVPRNARQLRGYFHDVRRELVGGRQALETAQWLLNTPAQPGAWLPQALLNAAAVGLLPAWVRRELRLNRVPFVDPMDVVDPVVVRPAATVLVAILRWALSPNLVREAARCRFRRRAAVRTKPKPRSRLAGTVRRPVRVRGAALTGRGVA